MASQLEIRSCLSNIRHRKLLFAEGFSSWLGGIELRVVERSAEFNPQSPNHARIAYFSFVLSSPSFPGLESLRNWKMRIEQTLFGKSLLCIERKS
jgi:hypothetical protein